MEDEKAPPGPGMERIMEDGSAQAAPPPVRAPASAADVMNPALSTVEPNDHVAAAAYLMKRRMATALVIVDNEEDRRPEGLITEADIAHAVADGKDLNEVRIRDLMTKSPTVIPAVTRIPDAARIMIAGRFRHLPVVSEESALIGMVDITDVCNALLEYSGG
jgi:CBS domain-containing protein